VLTPRLAAWTSVFARASVHLAWALTVIAGCGGAPAGVHDAGVESRLCARIKSCGLLPEDSGVTDCGDLLSHCTRDLNSQARAEWEHAIEQCLSRATCEPLRQCYLDAPGC
jgi:hypothetical protein